MIHYITDRPEYKHSVEVKECHVPKGLYHMRIQHRSINETTGKEFHSSYHDLFLDKNQLTELIKSLQTV